MKISGATKVFGIFGHPVSHSFSPRMHNAAFNHLGLDCAYVPFDVEPSGLENSTRAIKSLSISGVNITIPHKQAIIPFLDEISPEAELTGAVNSVANVGGTLKGYNTDVGGFLRALREELGFEPQGTQIALIGAGGAARAVLTGLCMRGASKITIVNRTLGRAAGLAQEYSSNFGSIGFEVCALDDKGLLEETLSTTDLLVNATAGGMKGAGDLMLPLESLKESLNPGARVYDLVYNPTDTELVIKASAQGLRAVSGLGMLIYQGAESFLIWTGQPAPIEVMRKALDY